MSRTANVYLAGYGRKHEKDVMMCAGFAATICYSDSKIPTYLSQKHRVENMEQGFLLFLGEVLAILPEKTTQVTILPVIHEEEKKISIDAASFLKKGIALPWIYERFPKYPELVCRIYIQRKRMKLIMDAETNPKKYLSSEEIENCNNRATDMLSQEMNEGIRPVISIYTTAVQSNCLDSWAAAIYRHGEKVQYVFGGEIPGMFSSLQLEYMAYVQAMSRLQEDVRVYFYSDNQDLMKHVQQGKKHIDLLYDIKRSFVHHMSTKNYKFHVWLPADARLEKLENLRNMAGKMEMVLADKVSAYNLPKTEFIFPGC